MLKASLQKGKSYLVVAVAFPLEVNATMEIPDDICFDVLTSLPVKSLLRFKCISKAWSLLISSPSFVDAHFSRSSSRPSLLTSFYIPTGGSLFFSSPLYEHPKQASFVATQLEFSPGKWFDYLPNQSLNGLMLFDVDDPTTLRVYNPSKRQSISIAVPPPTRKLFHPDVVQYGITYLLFEPVGKVHKLLRRTVYPFRENWVLTLGQQYSWRKIEHCPPHRDIDHSPVCIDGVLYYKGWKELTPSRFVLVAFDVRLENFQLFEIDLDLYPILMSELSKLINCGGRLGAVEYNYEPGYMDLWVLEDRIQMTCSMRRIALPSVYWMNLFAQTQVYVAGTINTREIIVVQEHLAFGSSHVRVFYHDIGSNSVRKVDIQGTPDLRCRLRNFTLCAESLY